MSRRGLPPWFSRVLLLACICTEASSFATSNRRDPRSPCVVSSTIPGTDEDEAQGSLTCTPVPSAGTAAAASPTVPCTSTLASDIPVPHEFPADRELPLPQLALAGALTTFFTDTLLHPMDCIKTLQQTDQGLSLGLVQAAAQIYHTMGWEGFYRGFLVYAIADGSGGAIKFAVWEQWKLVISTPKTKDSCTNNDDGDGNISAKSYLPRWLLLWIGAGMAFVASSVLVVPGELVKNQLQVGNYPGWYEAMDGIYSTYGATGFLDGYEGVLYRDVPYTMLELGLYEQCKSFFANRQVESLKAPMSNPNSMAAWQEIVAASVTGGITALATTPIDVIKTKLMVDDYDGFFDCMVSTVSNHGVAALFAGVVARVSWIVPFTAVYLPTYDLIKRRLLHRHKAHLEAMEPSQ